MVFVACLKLSIITGEAMGEGLGVRTSLLFKICVSSFIQIYIEIVGEEELFW